MAQVWLSALLMERGLAPASRFFTAIRLADKPRRAVLPVFFGQADACLISQSAFAVMTELNPQISAKTAILERSPGFVNLLTCATEHMEAGDRQRLVEETVSMHGHSDGQQVLTIIQMKRFFPFEPDDFKATEAVYRRYRRLMDQSN